MSVSIRVLGGLPIEVEADRILPAEKDTRSEPEVEWSIVGIGGRACKDGAPWLLKRLSNDDMNRIEDALLREEK